jgi:hypothetical protein
MREEEELQLHKEAASENRAKQPKPAEKPPIGSKQAFWIGALGGITPVMARGAGYLFTNTGQMPHLILGQLFGYACALVLMLVLGGIVAVFTDDVAARTIKSAFALGLSLPSLFQLGALQADAPKKTADISPPFHVAFIASAFAGEQDTGVAAPGPGSAKTYEDALASRRKLEVSTPTNEISKDVTATFLDKSGNRISSTVVQQGFAAVNVPAQAAAVQFEKDGAASDSHPLSAAPVQTTNVKIERSATNAFTQAIGLSRDAKVSIEAAKPTDAQKLPVKTYGWCYLGERGPDGWRTRYVDFPGEEVPQPGTVVAVNFPLNVRPNPESTDVIGVAHVGQRLRVEETQKRENLYWAAVTVVD